MKAIQLTAPRTFERLDVAEPAAPGPGEALVRVHRVGICGSDAGGYLGKMPFFSYPRIPGHELGVEVVAVGEGVQNVVPGDRCSVEPYINCERCYACRQGGGNCCENIEVMGVHRNGGLCERVLIPARKLHKSASLTFEQLALVETLAIGCHCVNRADPQSGDHVLLIGAGPIGLSVIEFLKLREGVHTTVMDMNAERLAFCKETMGIDHTIQFTGEETEQQTLKDITGGSMAKVVIDATGNAKAMSNAIQYVAHTGRLVYVGISTDTISFQHRVFHAREMALLGSRNAMPSDFDRIIQLIEEGRIDTRPWITHRTSFDALIEEFPTLIQPESGVIKAIVEVEE